MIVLYFDIFSSDIIDLDFVTTLLSKYILRAGWTKKIIIMKNSYINVHKIRPSQSVGRGYSKEKQLNKCNPQIG